MRYFTRGWLSGEYSDEDHEAAVVQYGARLESIRPALSPQVVSLTERNLHDGVIDFIEWDARTLELSLALIIGDQQCGYSQLRIDYKGAMLGEERLETLRQLARDRRVELLYDEVDVDERSVFQHRMIFWPTYEVTIDFTELELSDNPRTDRRIEHGDVFGEVYEDD